MLFRSYQTLYNHEDRCDPHAWAGGLIAKLLQQTVTLWNSRNKDVHGHDHVEQNVRLHALFTKQIAELHERQQESRHCDTHLFLDDHKSFCATRTAQQLDCWIRQYRPAIRTSYKLAAKQSIQRTRTITTYYKPRTRKSKQLHTAQTSITLKVETDTVVLLLSKASRTNTLISYPSLITDRKSVV